MNSSGYSKCLDDATDFSVWLLQRVGGFNRFHRFSVGQRLADEAVELALQIQQAAFGIQRADSLASANVRVMRIRLLLRMSNALQLLSASQLAFATGRLDEIGRQVGAWGRHARSEASRLPL